MKNRNNGSRIFMTELMFAILFFIVIAAVCVQCFAQSYVMSKMAESSTQAVNEASNAAELFVSYASGSDFTTYYDADWNEVEAADESNQYRVTGIVISDGKVETMDITVSKLANDEIIYALSVDRAVPFLED